MAEQHHDSFTHAPLPYIVRVRISADDDSVSQAREFRLVAYSAYEAILQALFAAGSTSLADAKVKVEEIGPDVAGYLKLISGGIEALRERNGAA